MGKWAKWDGMPNGGWTLHKLFPFHLEEVYTRNAFLRWTKITTGASWFGRAGSRRNAQNRNKCLEHHYGYLK